MPFFSKITAHICFAQALIYTPTLHPMLKTSYPINFSEITLKKYKQQMFKQISGNLTIILKLIYIFIFSLKTFDPKIELGEEVKEIGKSLFMHIQILDIIVLDEVWRDSLSSSKVPFGNGPLFFCYFGNSKISGQMLVFHKDRL